MGSNRSAVETGPGRAHFAENRFNREPFVVNAADNGGRSL